MSSFNRRDFKVSFEKERICFYVNEEKKVVTCTMEATVLVPTNYYDTVFIPQHYCKCVGVAKCHKDDEFDIERGKRIAMAKAENDAYKKASEYLMKYYKEILFFFISIGDFMEKCNNCCEHNEDYIISVSDKTHEKYKKNLKKVSCGQTFYK